MGDGAGSASGKEVLNVVGLLSGGKDSCFNLCHCTALGHRIVALATLCPPQGKDELDSYMYQTVGHDAVHLIAEAMDLPLYRTTITGQAVNQTSTYGNRLADTARSDHTSPIGTVHDETEDMYDLLRQVKRAHPEVNAISVGAILSNYQRVRVEHVAMRADLQLLPLSFLWQRDQGALMDEMCRASMNCILIKVAGAGLDESDLGKSLMQMRQKLYKLNKLYGSHICGEGGEYETLTLDCPLFKRRIVLDQVTSVTHGTSSSDGVYYLKVDKAHLEDKELSYNDALHDVTLPNVLDYQSERTLLQAHDMSTLRHTPEMVAQNESVPPQIQSISVARRGSWIAVGGVQGMISDDVQSDFLQAFLHLENTLRQQGVDLAHLMHVNVYLASQSDFAHLNTVYKSIFGVDPPTRACVALSQASSSSGSDRPHVSRILIDAIANAHAFSTSYGAARKALHVQGRSHWAAANIGPYSQAVEIHGSLTISGQIGLNTNTLQLVEQPECQIVLALQHVRRVFKAMLDERRIAQRQGWIESCICWLSDARWLPMAKAIWTSQSDVVREDGESDDGFSEEEGESQDVWDNEWLGKDLKSKDIPTAFVMLSDDGLPRAAAAEWQLTAHNGDRLSLSHDDGDDGDDDDDDEDDESKCAKPSACRGLERFGGWTCSWQSLSSISVKLSTGIAHLSSTRKEIKTDDDEEALVKHSSLRICDALAKALQVRVMYTQVDVPNFLQREPFASALAQTAVTLIPVLASYDAEMTPTDAVIVWQSKDF